MMDWYLGWLMTSMGMNWEQNGRTFSSAPTDLYSARTSGIATFFVCHLLYLNTGMLSLAAAKAVKKRTRILNQTNIKQ